MKTWKRHLIGAAGLFLALSLSGCSGMPTSGEPQAFNLAAPNTDPVEQLGFGPQRDSTPERIISDFLRATAAGTTDDFATARKYLTATQAMAWNPRGNVIVYPTDQTPTLTVNDVSDNLVNVTLETSVSATVSAEGILSPQDGTEIEAKFSVVKDSEDQWRIQQMDDGILLSQANFQAGYQAMQLYFLAPDQESLVPDPRWYPRRRLASYLVTGLLGGPSEQLAPSVYSALSDSLTLPTQGVEVAGQTVRVMMEGELPSSESSQRNISRQLAATLLQMTNVTGVEAEINATPLPAVEDPFGEALQLDGEIALDGAGIVVSDGDVWVPLVSAGVTSGDVHAPARGPAALTTIAWLEGEDTLAIVRGNEVLRSQIIGASRPTVDRWNWVWTVENGERIVVLDSRGNRVDLEIPGGTKGSLESISVSPDGVRLLLLFGNESGLQPYITAISRDPLSAPRKLSGLEPVGMAGSGILDASWAGYSHLVFLNEVDTERLVTVVTVGGFAQSLGAPPDSRRISGGAHSNQILLETASGAFFSRSGGVWRPLETDLQDISYAG